MSTDSTTRLNLGEEGRVCLFCEHFYIVMSSPGYSEYTPGEEFKMSCDREVWEYQKYGDENDYLRCIVMAQCCEQYVFNKSILKRTMNP